MSEPAEVERDQADWPRNYFNYFTEIEEYFQRARGSGLFLLSPLDWALIESWKNAGIPLQAVLNGIHEAFEKWHSRKRKHRAVNSVAYCSQAVLENAQRIPSGREGEQRGSEVPFGAQELRTYLEQAAQTLSAKPETAFREIASSVRTLATGSERYIYQLEELERRLTAIEDKMVAVARSLETEENLYSIRETLDRELKPYRGKMTTEQLAMLERRYLDSAILERAMLPRLSLFYLR